MSAPEGLKKLDIRAETWREYVFPDGFVYRIHAPVTLYTKAGSKSHRVVDLKGIAHYVVDWRIIRWEGDVIA